MAEQQQGSAFELYTNWNTEIESIFGPFVPIGKERAALPEQPGIDPTHLPTPRETPEIDTPSIPGTDTPEALEAAPEAANQPTNQPIQPRSADLDSRHIIEGKRIRKPSERSISTASILTAAASVIDPLTLPDPPRSHKDVLNHPNKAGYLEAEKKEIAKLLLSGTVIEVNKQEATDEPLDLKWVYTNKIDLTAKSPADRIKLKARLCVRGDQQEDNGQETYAATLAS